MKAYQDVCADLILLLEDIEESLEEIVRAAELPENQSESKKVKIDMFWLERHVDSNLKN